MKTIEERAKAYHDKIIKQNEQAEAWDFHNAYIAGATEQRAIDIEKACNAYCMESCGHLRTNCDCMSRMNIQKAMEE